MWISFIALFIALLSVLFILGGLRSVARDTVSVLSKTAMDAHQNGQLMPRMAFVLLWLMIFTLSYL